MPSWSKKQQFIPAVLSEAGFLNTELSRIQCSNTQFQSWRIMCVPVVLKAWFPRTSSLTWELKHLKHPKAWAHSRPTQSETLEVGSSHLYLTSPLGVYNVDTYLQANSPCVFPKLLFHQTFATANVSDHGNCYWCVCVCVCVCVCNEGMWKYCCLWWSFLEVSLIIDLFKCHLWLKTTWVSS